VLLLDKCLSLFISLRTHFRNFWTHPCIVDLWGYVKKYPQSVNFFLWLAPPLNAWAATSTETPYCFSDIFDLDYLVALHQLSSTWPHCLPHGSNKSSMQWLDFWRLKVEKFITDYQHSMVTVFCCNKPVQVDWHVQKGPNNTRWWGTFHTDNWREHWTNPHTLFLITERWLSMKWQTSYTLVTVLPKKSSTRLYFP
jgi:hypothetical protein